MHSLRGFSLETAWRSSPACWAASF